MMEKSTLVQCQKGKSCRRTYHIGITPTDSKNKFVYYALKYTFILASERLCSVGGSARSLRNSLQHGLDIVAVGDNDFYSQQTKVTGIGTS